MIDNTYDQYADEYAVLIDKAKKEEYSLYHDLVVRKLLDLCGDISDLNVLDAGCGAGHVSLLLAERGELVTAIDISPRLISIAKEKKKHTLITYYTHDLSKELPKYTERFDLIVSNLVLSDVPNYRAFISNLGRMAKNNSRALFSLNNPYSSVLRGKVTDYADSGESIEYSGLARGGVHVTYYHRTLEDYVSAFRSTGFLIRGLWDLIPPSNAPKKLFIRYRHFPFLMILELLKQNVQMRLSTS